MDAVFCLRSDDAELLPVCFVPLGNRYLYPLIFNDGYVSGVGSCEIEFTRCPDAACNGVQDASNPRWLSTDFFFLSFYIETLLEESTLNGLTQLSNQEYNTL